MAGYVSRRQRATRVAAPLAVPMALALTLGVVLAVSGQPVTHISQTSNITARAHHFPHAKPLPRVS